MATTQQDYFDDVVWRCVHAKPKCEHIAARNLSTLDGVEAFCPRIKFFRKTARGKVRFVEAMFPGYAFARFSLSESLRAVNAAHSVTRVVSFGGVYAEVEDKIVEDLRLEMGGDDAIEVKQALFEIGDQVEVAEGPLVGQAAEVVEVIEAKDRVRILMEILGQENVVEMPIMSVLGLKSVREAALPKT